MTFSILILATVFIISGLYLLGMLRMRRPGEPPLIKGAIPWLGNVLEFKNNGHAFLQEMLKNHGDVFTVQLAGHYFTFVMDPLSFGPVIREATSVLDFNEFARESAIKLFGYHSTLNDLHMLKESSTKHLMGDGLVVLAQAMTENLQTLMLYNMGRVKGDRKWLQGGLFNFTYSIIFKAGYCSLFGNEPVKSKGSEKRAQDCDWERSEKLFQEFVKYDQFVPRLIYSALSPKDKIEAERLKRFFWHRLSVKQTLQKENINGWITEQIRKRTEMGVPEHMQDRFLFSLLWVSQSNTGPACFWFLYYLMKYPEAMKAVRAEVEGVLKGTGQDIKPGGPLINLTRDMLRKVPIMDSAMEETLRLKAAPVLTRVAKENVKFKMASGMDVSIRREDRVVLFPYVSVQMNPEIHTDPQKFKYDRFLNEDGTKKTAFFKNGEKVKYYTMPWGAGGSICPGRFFAVNELKQFVFLMLSYFELELVNPNEEIPSIDPNRWGFGIMQPNNDVQFRYRLRF
ncbi:hypothetical protein XENTR_v10015754 [Xenopus tropicalis]|uniref:5-beta-cholestane-3-alpha,7-alpha-diol 12-alpha-hydroxylase n=1 Tax=Xenopus tropicalis TaxID=8364 RepID=A0A6I8RWQ0_XENTR|nr:5-beta-cholestane-3-alpha,7-alpha-diol 12-alpha-hydroxylase [Xenopus tropicalis]KAE8595449.1 hypothetical protein XENTR_v10015754 [Xenopus tropicalis]